MKTALIVVLAMGLLASGAAVAYDGSREGFGFYQRQQERDAAIRQREWRIRQWMHHAVEEGRLRPWEARHLYRELGYIRDKEHAFKADGRFDWREFAELNSDLDRLSQRIRSEVWSGGEPGYRYRPYGY